MSTIPVASIKKDQICTEIILLSQYYPPVPLPIRKGASIYKVYDKQMYK